MSKIEVLTDVPDSEVEQVMQDYRDAGANPVIKTPEPDGEWTVTAYFNDDKTAKAFQSSAKARHKAVARAENSLSILCVHGVGHGDSDPTLSLLWSDAITKNLNEWAPALHVIFDFLKYDDLFENATLNPATYAVAVAKLLASGIVHGIGDLFTRSRGLFDIPDQVRWTAGMVAQWAENATLRKQLRDRVTAKMQERKFDLVCAHSLGSLICYDAYLLNPTVIESKRFLTFGSQIGNPFVRDAFAGRIEPVNAKQWYHLFNPNDHVLTAEIRLSAPNFVEIGTEFDVPNDMLNHNPLWYFNHANTKSRVWRDIAGGPKNVSADRGMKAFHLLNTKPKHRALLIGINDYPDPANRLEGCVNDTFLMSSVLQECGFDAQDIRLVLNERATTAGMLDRLQWLLDDLCPGDQRVLFYSGHGAQIPAYGPTDEVDQMDECLVPYDFDWSPEHAITDKQFLKYYSQLPYDSDFTAVFDCCHAGGMTRDGGPKIRGLSPPDDIRHRALRWNLKLGMWEERPLDIPNSTLAKSRLGTAYLGENHDTYRLGRAISLRSLPKAQYDDRREALGHEGPYLPILLEACQENQLSYEYRHGATSYGAFTYSLAEVLRGQRQTGKNPTFQQLTDLTAKRLAALKYNQTPCTIGPSIKVTRPIPWARRTAGSPQKPRKK